MTVSQSFRFLPGLCCLVVLLSVPGQAVALEDPPQVCSNAELLKAIEIIEEACGEFTCDISKLMELDTRIDKPTLFGALRNPHLAPVHLFYPMNHSDIEDAFDWETLKKEQLESLKFVADPMSTIVYVLGRASRTGNREYNIQLSRDRALGVLKHIQSEVEKDFIHFHGAWVGKEVLQLQRSDARLLNLEPQDFREDDLVMNQAVHVFVFPCADLLDSHTKEEGATDAAR